MSITEKRVDYVVCPGGFLLEVGNSAGDGRPQVREGVCKNECGLARMFIDYKGHWGGPWTQHLYAETVILGRLYTLHQERRRPDYLTETGAFRVVHRWLREIGA